MTMLPTRRAILRNAAKSLVFFGASSSFFSFISCRNKDKKKTDQAKVKTSACTTGTNFNVVLHGLFFIELWDATSPEDQRVRIVSPDCSALDIPHAYRAGSWSTGRFHGFSRQKTFYSGWKLPTTAMPTITVAKMENYAGRLAYAQQYFSLYLPYPKQITALKALDNAIVSHSPKITDGDFPLVLALTYDDQQRPSLPLMPVPSGSWDPNSNFHIFAEPECEMSCGDMIKHDNDTLAEAQKMFPTSADYNVSLKTQVDCSNPNSQPTIKQYPCPTTLGVQPEEEQSLADISPCNNFGGGKMIPAVHMPTCASVVLTPP